MVRRGWGGEASGEGGGKGAGGEKEGIRAGMGWAPSFLSLCEAVFPDCSAWKGVGIAVGREGTQQRTLILIEDLKKTNKGGESCLSIARGEKDRYGCWERGDESQEARKGAQSPSRQVRQEV